MLSRLFSGPDAEPAAATRSPRSATPTRRSTAGAGASVSNILEFGGDFPPADGRQPRRTPSPSTGAPTSGSSRPPTTSPPTLYAGRPELLPLEPKPGAARRRGPRGRARDLRRRAGLARRPGDRRRHATRWPEPAWREIGVLTRDNAHAAARLRRAERPRDPGRDRRSQGPAPAARGRRGGRHAHPGPGRHRQRRAAHAAGRAALGDRAARPRPARPPGPRAGRRPAGGEQLRRRRRPSSRRPSRAPTRPRSPSLVRRARGPGRPRLLARGARAVPRCSPTSCAGCARRSASRSSTWSAGSST